VGRAARAWCAEFAKGVAGEARALGLEAAGEPALEAWRRLAGAGAGQQGAAAADAAPSRGGRRDAGALKEPSSAAEVEGAASAAVALLLRIEGVGEAHGRVRRAWLAVEVGAGCA
jgi:hypothetical protein